METKTELEQWLERLEAMGGPKGFLRATRNNQDDRQMKELKKKFSHYHNRHIRALNGVV